MVQAIAMTEDHKPEAPGPMHGILGGARGSFHERGVLFVGKDHVFQGLSWSRHFLNPPAYTCTCVFVQNEGP